jgi:hypothetical protein
VVEADAAAAPPQADEAGDAINVVIDDACKGARARSARQSVQSSRSPALTAAAHCVCDLKRFRPATCGLERLKTDGPGF